MCQKKSFANLPLKFSSIGGYEFISLGLLLTKTNKQTANKQTNPWWYFNSFDDLDLWL